MEIKELELTEETKKMIDSHNALMEWCKKELNKSYSIFGIPEDRQGEPQERIEKTLKELL